MRNTNWAIYRIRLIIITNIVLLVGCGNNKENVESKVINNQSDISNTKVTNANVIKPFCVQDTIINSFKNDNVEIILAKFKTMMSINQDSCVLSYVDIAFEHFKEYPTQRAYEIISSLSCSFDGYISESAVDKFDEIFHDTKLKDKFLGYLYNEYRKEPNSTCLYSHVRLYLEVYNKDFAKSVRIKNRNEEYNTFLNRLISR